MTELKDAVPQIEKCFDQSPATLTAQKVPVKSLAWLLDQILGQKPMTFAEKPAVVYDPEKQEVITTGRGSFLDYADMDVEIRLRNGKAVSAELIARFPADRRMALPGVTWFELAELRMEFTPDSILKEGVEAKIDPTYVRTIFKAALRFGSKVEIPIAFEPYWSEEDSWRLYLDIDEPLPLSGIEDLAGIIGNFDPKAAFPPQLDAFLSNIGLGRLDSAFSIDRGEVDLIALELTELSEPWSLLPGVELTHANLSMIARHPADPDSRFLQVIVRGRFDIKRDDEVVALLPMEAEVSNRTIALRLGGWEPVSLPHISDLAGVLFGTDVSDHLPPQVATIGKIEIDLFEISYSVREKRLEHIVLRVSGTQPWILLPDFLSVSDMAFRMEIEAPLTPDERKFQVGLGGKIELAGIEIPIAVARTAGRMWHFDVVRVQLPGLQALLASLGGEALAGALPPGLAGLGGIRLEKFQLKFDEAQLGVAALDASITAIDSWSPLGEDNTLVTISDVHMEASLTPDDNNRLTHFTGGFGGTVAAFGATATLKAEIQDELRLAFTLKDLSLGAIIRQFLGPDATLPLVPEVTFKELSVICKPETNYIHVTADISGSWSLPFGDGVNMDFSRVFLEFEQGVGKPLTCSLDAAGSCTFADGLSIEKFEFSFQYDQEKKSWNLGGATDINAFERRMSLGASYAVDGDKKTLTLSGNFSRLPHTLRDTDFIEIVNDDISVDEKTSQAIWNDLVTAGYLDETGLTTKKFTEADEDDALLEFLSQDYDALKNEIIAVLESSQSLIPIQPIADIDIKALSLVVVKSGDADAEWNFSAGSDIKIYDRTQSGRTVFRLKDGTLRIAKDSRKTKLQFDAGKAKLSFPRIPYTEVVEVEDGTDESGNKTFKNETQKRKLGLDIDFKTISIEKDRDKGWAFEGAVEFCFIDMPFPLNQVFAQEIPGHCKAGADGFSLWARGKGGASLAGLEIPDLVNELTKHDPESAGNLPKLGRGYFGLQKLKLQLGTDLSLEMTFGLGLPSRLNELIGLEARQLIRTYEEGDPTSLIKMKLHLGTDKIEGQLTDSPFQKLEEAITDIEKDGRQWLELNLDAIFGKPDEKELGSISVQKPSFSFVPANGSFKASGGYEIGPDGVKIPLFPLKKVLELANLKELAETVPPGIPVKTIELIHEDETTGEKSLAKGLEALFTSVLPDIPREFFDALELLEKQLKIDGILNKLPDRFVEYLKISIPSRMTFDIDVTPDGSVSFALEVDKKGDPFQLLLPCPTQLLGIRLYGLSFGVAFGGLLLKLEVDGEFDAFDLITLGGALLLPFDDEKFADFLPERSKLRQTFIMRELVVLIIYQTGIPIPIPLFYKRLAISSTGIDGLEVRTELSFPKPAFDATELLQRIQALKEFFTTPYEMTADGTDSGLLELANHGLKLEPGDYKALDDPGAGAEKPDAKMDLRARVGPMFLRFPKYFDTEPDMVFEITRDAYNKPEIKGIENIDALEGLINERFVTKAGIKSAIADAIETSGKTLTIDNALIDKFFTRKKELGQTIGLKKRFEICAWDTAYAVLNAVKKRSVNYLIQYLHIDDRIGSFDMHLFKVFRIYAVWALTTPKEFEDKAYPKLKAEYAKRTADANLPVPLKESPADELFGLIAENDTGQAVTEDTEGVVLFMRGGLQLTNAVVLESAFGLMAEGVRGFRIGVSFFGYVANIADLRLLGFIKVSPKSEKETIKLLGKASLDILNRKVMRGLFEFTNDHLIISGMLDLFPEDWPIKLKGHVNGLIRSDEFDFEDGAKRKTIELGTIKYDSEAIFELGALKAMAAVHIHAEDRIVPKKFEKSRFEKIIGKLNGADKKLLTAAYAQSYRLMPNPNTDMLNRISDILKSSASNKDLLKKEDINPINKLTLRVQFLNSSLFARFLEEVGSTRAAMLLDLDLNALNIIKFSSRLTASIDIATGAVLNGRSTLDVNYPVPGRPALKAVHTEMLLKGELRPRDGFLAIEAELTKNSFILSEKCRVFGGFAFYAWFLKDKARNISAGDFVLSLGGYHPDFRLPAHYPKVTPIGINWQVAANVSIKGLVYFALTPACIMTGGELQAVWQSGGLKAWFTAHAHFLLAWQPFAYHTDLHVNMGVSYTFRWFGATKTLSYQIGADLELWGPDLSGRAHVDIGIISFGISFGGKKPAKPAVIDKWTDFRKEFLPETPILGLAATSGLVRETGGNTEKPADSAVKGEGKAWVINPHEFSLRTRSVVPVNVVDFGKAKAKESNDNHYKKAAFGVAPMGIKAVNLESKKEIKIYKVIQVKEPVGGSDLSEVSDLFEFNPIYSNAPKALWGESRQPDLKAPSALVEDTVTGFDIRVKDRDKFAAEPAVYPMDMLQKAGPPQASFDWVETTEYRKTDTDGREEIARTIDTTQPKRTEILAALGYNQEDFSLANLSETTEDAFLFAPGVWELKS